VCEQCREIVTVSLVQGGSAGPINLLLLLGVVGFVGGWAMVNLEFGSIMALAFGMQAYWWSAVRVLFSSVRCDNCGSDRHVPLTCRRAKELVGDALDEEVRHVQREASVKRVAATIDVPVKRDGRGVLAKVFLKPTK